jgi:hypothetical protein
MARRRAVFSGLRANEALRKLGNGKKSGVGKIPAKKILPQAPTFPMEHKSFVSGHAMLPMARYGLGVEGVEERLAAGRREAHEAELSARQGREARERAEAAKIEHTKRMDFSDARAVFLKQHDSKNAEIRIPETTLNLMLNWAEEKKGAVRVALGAELRKKRNRSEYIGKVALTDSEFKRVLSESLAQQHNIPFKVAVAFSNWYFWARKLQKPK